MKTNELRIGNCVSDEYLDYQIEEIYGSNVWCAIIGYPKSKYNIKITNIKGIILIEDWLKKFRYERQNELIENRICLPGGGDNGFDGAIEYEKKGNYYPIFYYKNEYYFIIDENSDDYGFNYTSKRIKYVHQLQNLYFALTGKELE